MTGSRVGIELTVALPIGFHALDVLLYTSAGQGLGEVRA